MKTLALLLVAVAAWAQTPPKDELSNWFGGGALYGSTQSPHFSGWAAMAFPVSPPAGAYSFTLYQAFLSHGKATTSTTTGVDDILKTVKTPKVAYTLHGIAAIGVATAPTATTGALAGGGGVMAEYRQKVWIFPAGFTFEVFALQNKAAAPAKPNILIGFGRTW